MAFLEKELFIAESNIPGAGMGLFTRVAIPKGTRIVEYKGKISTWSEVDSQDGLNPYIYYVSDEHVIDAAKRKKSLARYINDARGFKKIKGLTNNAYYIEDGTRVFVDAYKDIPAGAEILVSYGKEYWDVLKKNFKELEQEKKKA
jgi:SET domain-containing protein